MFEGVPTSIRQGLVLWECAYGFAIDFGYVELRRVTHPTRHNSQHPPASQFSPPSQWRNDDTMQKYVFRCRANLKCVCFAVRHGVVDRDIIGDIAKIEDCPNKQQPGSGFAQTGKPEQAIRESGWLTRGAYLGKKGCTCHPGSSRLLWLP